MQHRLQFKDFEIEDYDKIKDPVEPLCSADPDIDFSVGVNTTAVSGDIPVACGGLLPYTNDRWIAWTKISCSQLRFPIDTVKFLKKGIEILSESMGNPIMVALVADGFKRGHKLSLFLGFEPTDVTYDIGDKTYREYERKIG